MAITSMCNDLVFEGKMTGFEKTDLCNKKTGLHEEFSGKEETN